MAPDRRRAAVFLLSSLGWSLGLFALLRAPWVEERLVRPATRIQEDAAEYYVGRPAAPIAVTLECSGADVIALCLGVILACPVSWRVRLAGTGGGVALILGLNTLRIATLGQAAASPALFRALHLQVWPAILVLAAGTYVFAWMRGVLSTRARGPEETGTRAVTLSPLLRRFAPRAAALLVGFALCGPWIARSETLLVAGAWAVQTAAFVLSVAGIAAAASGNVLATSRGAYTVTPECLATALIPLYLAGVLAARLSWPRRVLALVAAPPLFASLAIARLLLLALPPAVAPSPLFLVHGFHQMVLAVAAVALFALWREPPTPGRWPRAARRAALALGAAAALAVLAGGALTATVLGAARIVAALVPRTLTVLTAPGDAQGALALLPVYQAALLLGLAIATLSGWRRALWAFGALLASQVLLLVVLGEMAAPDRVPAHALLVRGWAVAVPVALMLVMTRRVASRSMGPVATLRPAVDGPR